MRDQEIFFEQKVDGRRIVILKTYERALAHAAFQQMTPHALEALAASLDLKASFDPADIPCSSDGEFPDFLWGVVEDGAREDWDSFSYFIVRQTEDDHTVALFVSSDWPSAEAYARNMLAVPA